MGPELPRDQSHLYQNDNGVFTDVSTAAGVTDTGQGRGLLSLDYDNDGDLDVFIVNHGAKPILYRNDGGNDNDWLKIKRRGDRFQPRRHRRFITVDPDTMSSATRSSGRSTREAISSARTS